MKWYDNIDIKNEININDISEEYKHIVQSMGFEAFINLIELVGGTNYYVPTIETFLRDFRNRKISTEYNGYNKKELSKKYDISIKQICHIIDSK